MLNRFKKIFNGYTPTEQEAQFISIVDGLLKHPKTSIKMTPLTDKYYLSNPKLHYWIMIKDSGIQINNSKFYCAKNIHPKAYNLIVSKVQEVMEVERQDFEDHIFKRESDMLNGVLGTLNKGL